ncbi:hypothetical protein [Pelagibacterium lentulum]|uniref:Carboxymuconolactone decarboxylase-like domain-containing protein n=1 Tax=Pelagibacterium lentulum TaxID=2029865 RepID=A0A916RQ78_9HYPH|nr:hypothetical protein [Pelagibacterium lentulum]GGA63208.1 hypothetical protein GCM10011499_37000 [Pelagibacterium lentulum]
MAYIPQLDLNAATEEQRAAYDAEIALRGRMTNMKRTLAHSPEALRIYGEWFTLRDQLQPAIGDRAIFTLCLAISKAMDNRVGMGFMRRGLASLGAEDGNQPGIDLLDIETFGRAIATDAKSIPPALWARLGAQLSPKTLVDLTALAGIMIATNGFMSAVGTEVDQELAQFID